MFDETEIKELIEKALDTAYQKFQEKKFEMVCVVTNQILKINPDNCNAMQLLGLSYSALQRHDEAVEVLSKCLEHHPDNPETLNDLALSYSNKRNFQKSIELIEKAKAKNVKLLLPADSVIADKFDAAANTSTFCFSSITSTNRSQ